LMVDSDAEVRQGRHRVVNRCFSATGSSLVARNFEYMFCDAQDQLDLVIMEFASNDLANNEPLTLGESPANLTESAPKYMEFIVRKLDSLNISYLSLQASFRYYRDVPPHHFNAESVHLPIQKYYDIPTISFPATFLERFLDERKNYYSKYFASHIFRDSNSHQTGYGHSLIAYTLLWNIQRDLFLKERSHSRILASSRPFFALKNIYWSMLTGKVSQNFDFSQSILTNSLSNFINFSQTWNHTDEGRRKWGLVSSTPGDQIEVKFAHPDDVYAISIGFLRSYMGMGAFKITFLSNSENYSDVVRVTQPYVLKDEETSQRTLLLKSYQIDCLWTSRTSQYFQESLLVPDGSDGFILEVISALADGRSGRGLKTKILSLAVYSKSPSCGEVAFPYHIPPAQNQAHPTMTTQPTIAQQKWTPPPRRSRVPKTVAVVQAEQLSSVSSFITNQSPLAFALIGILFFLFIGVALLVVIAIRSSRRHKLGSLPSSQQEVMLAKYAKKETSES
jgi:hypothetical protein